jgi:hypothetical protein
MTEKKKSMFLVGLLAVAGTVWYLNWNGSAVGISRSSPDAPYTPLAVDSLALRLDKLERSRRTEYRNIGADLFTGIAVVSVQRQAKNPDPPFTPQGPVQPPPPEPPKLPVKFFGYGTIRNGTLKRAFLTDGEDVFIVGEGDTLLGRFRVVHIGNANLEFEEISSHMRGTAPLEEQAAPPA